MMNMKLRTAVLALVVIGSLACNIVTTSPLATATMQASPTLKEGQAFLTPDPVQPTPRQVTDAAQPSVSLDPCTLVMAAEAEAILGQPVGPASPMSGACAYSSASDAIYMVSAAAAQDEEASNILQGQMMMLGLGGVQLDEASVNNLRSLAEGMDYKGFFTELVAISQGAATMKTQLVEDSENDVAYWVWVSAQSRRQGGFVAARGQTLVNINLIVADTQTEEVILAAATSLADQAFGRLPTKFTLAAPTPEAPPPTATNVAPVKTLIGIWERRTADLTEQLVFNADGSYSVQARNNSTNGIVLSNSGTFTYDGNAIYYVDKDKKEITESYTLNQDGDVLVINNQTDRSWTRME